MTNINLPWTVLLIGGASGCGKTSVSYDVARHFGIGITEVDDFQVILQKMTSPQQQPALHFWNTHPNPTALSPEEIFEQGLEIGEVMTPALQAVIDNHIESRQPIVLEGDFIHPALATHYKEQVCAVFIYEPDESQILANYLRREPESGPQTFRARVSWLKGEWLKREAEYLGQTVLLSRPWDTLLSRLVATVEGLSGNGTESWRKRRGC
jgi:2-phosphoglycerate kinase